MRLVGVEEEGVALGQGEVAGSQGAGELAPGYNDLPDNPGTVGREGIRALAGRDSVPEHLDAATLIGGRERLAHYPGLRSDECLSLRTANHAGRALIDAGRFAEQCRDGRLQALGDLTGDADRRVLDAALDLREHRPADAAQTGEPLERQPFPLSPCLDRLADFHALLPYRPREALLL